MKYLVAILILAGCAGKPKAVKKDSARGPVALLTVNGSGTVTTPIPTHGDTLFPVTRDTGGITSIHGFTGGLDISINTDTVLHFDSVGLSYKTIWHCDTIWVHHKKHSKLKW